MIDEYHFDKLNIGGSLECLLHSFLNDEQALIIDPLYPFGLETVEYRDDLKFLGYNKKDKIYKSEIWDRLSFIMSMVGKIIVPNIITNHRLEDNKAVLITDFNKRITINFKELCLFDSVDDRTIDVYDWFNVRSGNNHTHSVLKDKKHMFVHTLHFYEATRIGNNRTMKDACAASTLKSKDLLSVHYTEGIARLKVLKMMKEAGIRGQSNGTSKSGIRLHYALKIEHTHREVKERYAPFKSIDEILKNRNRGGEAWNLAKKLFRHKQISTLRESFRLPANL